MESTTGLMITIGVVISVILVLVVGASGLVVWLVTRKQGRDE
jgi:hypothetical protein